MGIGVIVASMALTHEAGEHNPHPQLLKTKEIKYEKYLFLLDVAQF